MTTFDTERETLEMEALERKYVGLTHQARVEGLGRRLAIAPIGVARFRAWSAGRKLRLLLDCGSTLTLTLFWPCLVAPHRLVRIGWDQRIGWQIDVASTGGAVTPLFAWRARLDYRST